GTTFFPLRQRPLSTLKMCVSGLDNPRMMADADGRHELLADTRDALDTLSAYFSKMRDITFNDVTQIPLNISDIDLSALATRVRQTAPNPTHKRVNIVVDIPEGLTVHADPSHMYNILSNLVENAIKYSSDEVSVTISASETPDGVAITVTDNGIGIPASDLGHIFNRFYRGRASAGDVPGIGLGLTYVRLLTEAHGGTGEGKSTHGRGTCFTINLPQR
ncbi:MAG: HAMP domain-containing histidine kinase, partial [Duncaniella sp.]|nr:HAMP domain-containing histidine kinase [Duncaniella sp.]